MKEAGQRAGSISRGRRRIAPPRRLGRISAYLGDGNVGSRARGAPTSSLAQVAACGPPLARADPTPRHTVDRGASCATPSREVELRLCCVGRRAQAIEIARDPRPDGRRRTMSAAWLVWAQRFGMGPRIVRGNMSPKAASGGPIHARLALGNSAMPALYMPRSDAPGFWANPALLTRTLFLLECPLVRASPPPAAHSPALASKVC